MVETTETTPFRGVVASNRQRKKAVKGTEVEVRVIKEGKFGWYALAFITGQDKPIFLSPTNIDRIGDVSEQRVAELDAEREAWKAKRDPPIEVGEGILHDGGKSVVIPVLVTCEMTNQTVIRKAFFPLSQVTLDDGVYSAPQWLVKIKAYDAIYFWVSRGGRKGVSHLGNRAKLSAEIGNVEYCADWSDLQQAQSRSEDWR